MGMSWKRVGIAAGTLGLSELRQRKPFQYWSNGSGDGDGGAAPNYYESGAGKTYDPMRIKQIYQQVVGRDPNQNELDHFKQYVENGDLSYNEVANIAGSLPEVQQRLLETQTNDLGNRLGASDDMIMDRSLGALESHYRQLGRPQTTGFDSSFARSAQDLALSRQDALNSFYSNGLGGVRDAYNTLGQNAEQGGYSRANSRTDYNRGVNLAQMGQAYQSNREADSFRMQQRMAGGQLAGTLLGGALGLATGKPMFALAGAQIGGQVGQNYQMQQGGLIRR